MQICGPSNTHVISLIRPLLSPFPHALCQIMRMAACPIGQSDRVLVLYDHIRAWHDGLSCEETERSAVYHPPTARMQNHRPHTDSFIIYWSCWPWECYEPFMLFTCYLKHYPEWLYGLQNGGNPGMGLIMCLTLSMYLSWWKLGTKSFLLWNGRYFLKNVTVILFHAIQWPGAVMLH